MEKAGKRAEITAARVLEEMGLLAFYNAADYIKVDEDGTAIVDLSKLDRDQAAAIAEVICERGEDGKVKTDAHQARGQESRARRAWPTFWIMD